MFLFFSNVLLSLDHVGWPRTVSKWPILNGFSSLPRLVRLNFFWDEIYKWWFPKPIDIFFHGAWLFYHKFLGVELLHIDFVPLVWVCVCVLISFPANFSDFFHWQTATTDCAHACRILKLVISCSFLEWQPNWQHWCHVLAELPIEGGTQIRALRLAWMCSIECFFKRLFVFFVRINLLGWRIYI